MEEKRPIPPVEFAFPPEAKGSPNAVGINRGGTAPVHMAAATRSEWAQLRTILGIAMAVTVDTPHEAPMWQALDAMGGLLDDVYENAKKPC